MKNKQMRILLPLLLAAACLLTGCGAAGSAREEIPVFGDMPYERPDVETLREDAASVHRALEGAKAWKLWKLPGVLSRLEEFYTDYWDFQTQYTLAYIRSSQDGTDSYYAEEYAWCDAASAEAGQVLEQLLFDCGMSPLCDALERSYFGQDALEDYKDDSNSIYDEEMVAMLQVESGLLARYRDIMANGTVESPYGEMNYTLYLGSLEPADYFNGLMKFYYKYNEELSQIYIDLVKLRQAMAAKQGYDNYEQMQYDYTWERSYTPDQAEAYVADIRRHIVPLYRQLEAELFSVDAGVLDEETLFSLMEDAAGVMGGEMEETFAFLKKYQLYDTRMDSRKYAGSFQTYLDSYEAPFLFMTPQGNGRDLLTFAHEFGHCVDSFTNFNAAETVDVAESFSQALEYLIPDYLDLDEDMRQTLYRIKMLDTMELYVQQGSFAAFEHEVYNSDPDTLSADSLNALSLRLAEDFGYYDGVNQAYYAMSWTDISHFFEVPLYIIAYPVSNDVAMQIYEQEQAEAGAGLATFRTMLPLTQEDFLDMVSQGGLQSPFAPGRLGRVAEDLAQRLDAELPAAA